MEPPIRPLDLAEIRLYLVPFLSSESLRFCVLVSRAWKDSFEPFLWQDVIVRDDGTSPTALLPPIQKLIENAVRVRRLCFTRGTLRRTIKATQPPAQSSTSSSSSMLSTLDLFFPRLQALDMLQYDPADQNEEFEHFAHGPVKKQSSADAPLPEEIVLSKHAATLQDLSLTVNPWQLKATRIWNTIAICAKLERLVVMDSKIEREHWSIFWRILCSGTIKVLSLSILFDDDPVATSPLLPWNTPMGYGAGMTTRIQNLTFRIPKAMRLRPLVEILKRCPELTVLTLEMERSSISTDPCTLNWFQTITGHASPNYLDTRSRHDKIMSALTVAVKGSAGGGGASGIDSSNSNDSGSDNAGADGCPKLVSLSINNSVIREPDLIEFLETRSETGLKVLSLPRSCFGPRSWKVLKRIERFAPTRTIKVLELIRALPVTMEMVQDMLCSLPGLEIFSAEKLTNLELERDPRDWVCLGLRVLVLSLGIIADESGSQLVMMQNLAKLTKLEVLNMNESYFLLRPVVLPLRFRLDMGLGLLGGLTRLGKVVVRDHDMNLQQEDRAWIREHWGQADFFWDDKKLQI
ncbi:hypothetical protein BGZ83_002284 [Gryganskiella cystojenkinii]|nr:hypothetical protein BGZ83_002284 [Gryganskiella cystojenkinii]